MEYFSKDRLKNNVSYFGIHEDTAVAKWDSREECFWYIELPTQGCFPLATALMLKHPADGGSFKPIAELFGEGDTNTATKGVG